MSFFHFMNIDFSILISNIHRIFTLDIEMQISVKSSSTLISVHLFSFMQTPEYRSNTSLNFSIFESSLDYKVFSILISEHWQFLFQHYLNSRFSNILIDIIQYDARVEYEKSHICIHDCNHSSIFHISMEISRNIASEIVVNHIVKLHSLSQFYYLSSLDATKKYIDEIKTD